MAFDTDDDVWDTVGRDRNRTPLREAFVPPIQGIKSYYKNPDIPAVWDTQVGGEHYKLPIQPLQYALANNLGIMEHAVVKYVTRHLSKEGKQDLEKARDYIDKMIAHYYS